MPRPKSKDPLKPRTLRTTDDEWDAYHRGAEANSETLADLVRRGAGKEAAEAMRLLDPTCRCGCGRHVRQGCAVLEKGRMVHRKCAKKK